jgi:hypothetical protein
MLQTRLFSAGLLLVGSLFIMSPAYAVDVSYFTTGSFSGGTAAGTNVYHSGGLTITYTGVTAQNPNVTVGPFDPSNGSFGSFQVTGTGSVNTTFTLDVTQVSPGSSATEAFASNLLTGPITAKKASLVVNFLAAGNGAGGPSTFDLDPLSFVPAQMFTLNGIEYWLDETTKLNPQNTNLGLSSITGTIDSTTPEPGFYALTGMGLAGVFAVVRRRKIQVRG